MAELDDDEALRAKLDALRGRLAQRNKEEQAKNAPQTSDGSAMSMGLRAAGEFIAPIFIGVAIGWKLDGWLGVKPAFLIAFFLLGAGVGVWNVVRATSPRPAPKDRNSRLSDSHAQDKDVRRSAPAAEPGGPNGADDDED